MNITEELLRWTNLKVKLATASPSINLHFKEREIWWASVGINIGFEINGKNLLFERPVLILKKFNHHTFWGLPLTSQKKSGTYYFPLQQDKRGSLIILSQLRFMSSQRLQRKIGSISAQEFLQVKQTIRQLL